MTTLVDLNQVIYQNFFASVGKHTNIKVEIGPMRGLILNTVRYTNKIFKANHKKMVLALDSRSSWRKDIFPYYKAHRSEERNKSDVDWDGIHKAVDKIKLELIEFFPYTFIEVDGCEADDTIAVIVEAHSHEDPMVIVSKDKDFRQLHKYPNVSQYDPIDNKYVVEDNPHQYLREHIVSGDRTDGIPNIICSDDYFVGSSPTKRLTQKRRDELKGIENRPNDKYYENWKRNQKLIDLSMVPQHLKQEILDRYAAGPKMKDRSQIHKYLVASKQGNMLRFLNDF